MGELSLAEKGREFLELGDVSSALACYERVFDPDSLDEQEARTMLIEGRSNLSRKRLSEALDCFEEALVMGTDVQRRQALDGLADVGRIKAKLKALTSVLKKGLKKCFGSKRILSPGGPAFLSDSENLVLISSETLEKLPKHLLRSSRIQELPPHLADMILPIPADRCIPYTDESDISYILQISEHLATRAGDEENGGEPDPTAAS